MNPLPDVCHLVPDQCNSDDQIVIPTMSSTRGQFNRKIPRATLHFILHIRDTAASCDLHLFMATVTKVKNTAVLYICWSLFSNLNVKANRLAARPKMVFPKTEKGLESRTQTAVQNKKAAAHC